MGTAIPLGLKTFTELMGDGEIPHPIKVASLNSPLWVEGVIRHAFQFRFKNVNEEMLFVEIDPKLSFDRILALVKALKKNQNKEVVIIADDLNPRFRALLVRERIPFVRGDEDIFAPRLNIKLNNLSTLAQMYPERTVDELSPFSLKIIAGALTGFLSPEHLKVNEIVSKIKEQKGKIVGSKVSVALRELVALELIREMGRGPDKYYVLGDKSETFKKLLKIPHARLLKRVTTQNTPRKNTFVYSGESALSRYTELVEPSKKTFAIHKRDDGLMEVDFSRNPIEVELWKEDPRVFACDGSINPIELYFSLKPIMDDPRIGKEMDSLLEKYGIKRESN